MKRFHAAGVATKSSRVRVLPAQKQPRGGVDVARMGADVSSYPDSLFLGQGADFKNKGAPKRRAAKNIQEPYSSDHAPVSNGVTDRRNGALESIFCRPFESGRTRRKGLLASRTWPPRSALPKTQSRARAALVRTLWFSSTASNWNELVGPGAVREGAASDFAWGREELPTRAQSVALEVKTQVALRH